MIIDIHGAFGTAANQTLGSILNEIKAKIDNLPPPVGLSPLQAQALADIHDAVARMESALKGA